MTWMTPLRASTSACTTEELPLRRTVWPAREIRTGLPCTVAAEGTRTTSAAVTRPGTTW